MKNRLYQIAFWILVIIGLLCIAGVLHADPSAIQRITSAGSLKITPTWGGGSSVDLEATNVVGSYTPSNAPLAVLPISAAPNIPVLNLNAQAWTNLAGTRVVSNQFFTNIGGTGPYITNDPIAGRAFYFPGDGSSLQSVSNLNEASSTYLTVMWLQNSAAAPSSTTIDWYTIGGALYMMRANTHLIVGSGLPQCAIPGMNGWTLTTLVFSNGTFWIRCNGMTSYEPTSGWSALGINAQLNFGNDSGFAFNGELAELVAWTNCFSQATLQQLEMGMWQRHLPTPQYQFLLVGDSIILGEEGGYSNIQYFANNAIGTNSAYLFGVDGNAGAFMSGMASYVSAYDLIPSLHPVVGGDGGINDIEGGNSATQTYSNLLAYVAHYRTNGASKFVYSTPTPFSTTLIGFTNGEAVRQSYLTLVSNNWSGLVDALADWGHDPLMGTTNNLFNTNYFPMESGPDYVHPSGMGNQILSTHLVNAVQGVTKGLGGVY